MRIGDAILRWSASDRTCQPGSLRPFIRQGSLRLLIAFAFSAAIFSTPLLPASVDQVSGRLTMMVTDNFAQHSSETKYFIGETSSRQIYEVHLNEPMRAELRTGMNVIGRGMKNGNILENAGIIALDTEAPRAGGLPAITPVHGSQKTLVIILESPASPSHFTNQQVYDMMYSQSGTSVNTIYQRVSFGSVSVVGDVAGPYAITPPTTCDTSNIDAQAEQAAQQAGFSISTYPHLVYMLPNEMEQSCSWTGVSYLGGNPGTSWINTGYFNYGVVYPNSFVILTHELGHQFNMQHAQAYQTDGSLAEYGDNSCTMGDIDYNAIGFHTPHLIEEGWIPLTNIQQVVSSGIYQVAIAETQTSAFQALQILPPDSTDVVYVSYRQASLPNDVDANLPTNFTAGATIHFWTGSNNKTQLPVGGTLADGQSYSYPGGSLKIEQIAHNSSYVTLSITITDPRVGVRRRRHR